MSVWQPPQGGGLQGPVTAGGLLRTEPRPASRAPVMITPLARQSIGVELAAVAAAIATSAPYPYIDFIIYVPFTLDEDVTVRKLFWLNGDVLSGTADVGIYRETTSGGGATRLVSSGATTPVGTNAVQEIDTADTALAPGRYYLALACNNTTQQFIRLVTAATGPPAPNAYILAKAMGVANQATTYPLPAAGAPAAAIVSYVPIFGASLRTLVA